MAVVVDMSKPVHLHFRADSRIFVTLCSDGNVIFEGHVMSLEEATKMILDDNRTPILCYWEHESI